MIGALIITTMLTLPNPALTPGDTTNATKAQICTPGYSSSVRNVTSATKNLVFQLYGLLRTQDRFEIDHLISLELGGSNDIKNLWPESYTTQPWNASVKDRLEGRLHYLVCNNRLDLKTAQEAIASNWQIAYLTYYPQETK